MSITNVDELARLASTSVATYATIASNVALAIALSDSRNGAKMAPSQAIAFDARYNFLSQQPNVPGNGFSATVFQDTVTGRKVLAIRGTEIPTDIVNDAVLADALGIGGAGFANNQGVELYRYWKRLTTVPGQAVTYSDEEVAKLYVMKNAAVSNLVQSLPTPGIALVEYVRQQAGFADFVATVRADVGADSGTPGQPVVQPGEQVDVTGHSLGGHLAMLFARLFPGNTHEVVTLNAPTFFAWGDATLSRLGYPPATSDNISRLEADGDGIHLLGNIDPGTVVNIAQEDSAAPFAALAGNHSSATGNDAMSLLALFSRLDPARTNDAMGLSALMRSASNEYARSFENMLDGLRRIVYGPDAPATPVAVGSEHPARAAFYDNIEALSARDAAGNYTNATFGTLVGAVSLQSTHDAQAARADFAALLSLTTGATFSLRLTDPSPTSAASLALYGVHRTAYEQWLSDRSLTTEQRQAGLANFSDAYLSDRAAMLNALAQANTLDRDFVNVTSGGASTFYEDRASGAPVLARAGTGTRTVAFGGNGTDSLEGGALDDRLYGGAGNDTISGLAGTDYIEGNAGNDSLVGGAGNDTLIGGTGTDTYSFVSGDGYDIIRDSDGLGKISVQGFGVLTGSNAKKVAPDAWQTADRSVNYTLVQVDATRRDLYITFADRNDVITIENWSPSKSLGITLEQLVATSEAPPTDQTLVLTDPAGPGGAYFPYPPNSSATIVGTPDADQIYSGDYNDVITGNGGGDRIYGNAGNDRIYAGTVTDIQAAIDAALVAGTPSYGSVTEGGAGDDLMLGTVSNWMYAGGGKDTIVGGGGVDWIQGDTSVGIFTEPGSTTTYRNEIYFDPAKGKYTYYFARTIAGANDYFARNGLLSAEGSSDVIYSGAGDDYVDGELGDDTLVLGEGNDIGLGREGNDTVVGEGGNDLIFGDFNYDASSVDTSLPEYLQYNYAGIHGALHGNDLLIGGAGNDTIQGNGGADTILGGDGADLIRGDDLITPAAFHGADSIDAGAGNDEVEGGALGDTIRGGADNDLLFGDGQRLAGQYHGADVLYGDGGADTVVGGGGADTIFGGAGDDALVGDNLEQDPLDAAYQAADQLFGEGGKDTLLGGGGADLLDGGADDDALFGEEGDDTLIGGSGADYLDGGAGNDTYVFSSSDSTLNAQGAADTIVDSSGFNRVVLTNALPSALSVWHDGSGGLVLDFGSQSRIIVDRGTSGAVASYTLGDGATYRFTELIGSFANGPVIATDENGRTYVMGGKNADSNLVTTAPGQTISGGRGDDSLRLLGDGGATVVFRSGDGLDNVYVNPDAVFANTLSLGEGIAATDLRLRVTNNSRVSQGVSGGWGAYIGTAQGEGMYSGRSADQILAGAGPFSTFTFSDGSSLTWQQLAAMRFVIDLPTDYSVLVRGTAFADEVTGDWRSRSFSLGEGDDLVKSGSGSETFWLGKGADTLVMQAGFGQDTVFIKDNIVESVGSFVGDTIGVDTIRFEEGLSAGDARIYRTWDNLIVKFMTGGEQLTVKGFFTVAGGAVIEFADGTTYTTESIPLAPISELATEAADYTYLTPLSDYFEALAGDDTVIGFAGNDTLVGGSGNDQLHGDLGDDVLYGNDGDDYLTGGLGDSGDGNDSLDGGAGNDTLDGGVGDNTYFFGRGDGMDRIDRYDPTAGKLNTLQLKEGIAPADLRLTRDGDALLVSIEGTLDSVRISGFFSSNNSPASSAGRAYNPVQQIRFIDGTLWNLAVMVEKAMTGTGGDDTIVGTRQSDLIQGAAGNDVLVGYGGNDTFRGGDGNDELIGDAGNDVMDGGAGNDIYMAGGGINTFQFGKGDGNDTVWYQSGVGATGTVSLKSGVLPSEVMVRLVDDPPNTLWPGVKTALELSIEGTTDTITVNNFTGPYSDRVVQQVRFADGTTWNVSQILAKQLLGTPNDDELVGTAGADLMRGRAGNDSLFADAGNDTVHGDAGDDYLDLGDGNDVASGGDGADGIFGGLGNDSIAGDAGDDYLGGYAGDDTILGGAGNDTLEGDRGDDILDGGSGDDVIWGSSGTDTYLFGKGDGFDTIYSDGWEDPAIDGFSTLQFKAGVQPSEVGLQRVYDAYWEQDVALEITIAGTTDRILVSGFFLNDDPISLENPLQRIRFDNGQVWDLATIAARASGSYVNQSPTLASPLADQAVNEMVPFSFTVPVGAFVDPDPGDSLAYGATLANGNPLPGWLTFNPATRTFTGTTTLGMLAQTSVQVTATDQGGASVSDVFVINVATQNLSLTGTSSANTLSGRSGDDTLNGAGGNDTLIGNAGNDSLNGGTGTDSMIGGTGNDAYVVDAGTDIIVEAPGEGTDSVSSTVSYTLPSNVENLTLTGTSNINGTGNALANVLVGNSGANSLSGGEGDDTIDGGSGSDTMVGGAGNDTFYVNVSTDVITEAAGGGTDTVMAAITYTLGANLENLTLTGSGVINGTGNAVANVLIGNGSANTLTGNAGADTLDGGAGNDSLLGGADADVYRFGAGYGVDTISENDTTANVKDGVQFVGTVTQANVQFKQVGNNLEVLLNGTTDKLVVQNWYLGSQYQVEEFRFTDGTVLTNVQAQGMVTAGAGLAVLSASVPSADAGVTTLGARRQIHMLRQPFADTMMREGEPTAMFVQPSAIVGRKSIQLPVIPADLPNAVMGSSIRNAEVIMVPFDRTLAFNGALGFGPRGDGDTPSAGGLWERPWSRFETGLATAVSSWQVSPGALLTSLRRLGAREAVPVSATVPFGRVVDRVTATMTGVEAMLPGEVVPSALPDEAVDEERKRTQPVGPTEKVRQDRWSHGHLDGFAGLTLGVGRFLPDIVATLPKSIGTIDATTERRTSALVDAMAAFSASAGAIETHAPASQRVLLENITMPGLRG